MEKNDAACEKSHALERAEVAAAEDGRTPVKRCPSRSGEGGRPFEIRRLKNLGESPACHVLFVCASEVKRLPEILAAAEKASILTVSDIERYAEVGGIINFYNENNRVRFKINLGAAERAGTKISSRLLRLGTIIRE